jgi:hypothetical protein
VTCAGWLVGQERYCGEGLCRPVNRRIVRDLLRGEQRLELTDKRELSGSEAEFGRTNVLIGRISSEITLRAVGVKS